MSSARGDRKKLCLVVVDGMRPASLQKAIADGSAPNFGRLIREGYESSECISSFPSLTPVATSTIVTGRGPGEHGVPSMNWYNRDERRYIDYGISFPAARKSGVITVLKDLVYRINQDHLSADTPTFFESLENAGIRCACTTYMIYRGPHEHNFVGSGVAGALAGVTGMSRPGYGPTDLLYGDIFDSLGTECRSSYGVPGKRDQHTACAGIELVLDNKYDFMLLSFPDNDNWSHRFGPDEQPAAIANADAQFQRVIDAAGGYRRFMEDHAVIVVSDHSHSVVHEAVDLFEILEAHEWEVLQPRKGKKPGDADIAVSPAARAAHIYVLDPAHLGGKLPLLVEDLRREAKIEQVFWLDEDEAYCALGEAELHFKPGTRYTDRRGLSWDVEGDLVALDLFVEGDEIHSEEYPDALARVWSALHCPGAGDLIITPELGYEFLDWGGVAHVGGGTHGSLHKADSAAQLIVTGTGESRRDQRAWSIADVNALVLEHFGVDHSGASIGD
ncbi:MAG: alkaline phosphatase family protein [Solirubrobacterales bacterium]|nr:alkaline phosphatase family protein [Solirubrobacterales bacterium]